MLLEKIADITLSEWRMAALLFVVLYIPAAYTLIWIRSAEPSFKDCDEDSCPITFWDEKIIA